jgi:hypothetical protein
MTLGSNASRKESVNKDNAVTKIDMAAVADNNCHHFPTNKSF